MDIISTKYYSFRVSNGDEVPLEEIEFRVVPESKDYTLPGYNYCGPGTKYYHNILSRVPPTSIIDELSKDHDKDYTEALSDKDIKEADRKFIKRLNKERKNMSVKEKLFSIVIVLIFKAKILLL